MLSAGLTVEDYAMIADSGFHYSLGEWVFSGVLNDNPDFGVAGMRDLSTRKSIAWETASAVRELAARFVDQSVAEILAGEPELVGFSCTFSQNAASLAVAKRIKLECPEVKIVIGGYNTEASMGTALHREFPFLDFVLRGEGDLSFPLLLKALDHYQITGDTKEFAQVPHLCWRDEKGTPQVNAQLAPLVAPVHMRKPEYADWFEQFEELTISEHILPELVIESSRGCWWGEKHQCTFCGLNGTGMTYRAKKPDVFVREVDELVRRHQVLDIVTIDNILPSDYLDTALPHLAATNLDIKFHYEIKANLHAEHIDTLRAARVWAIQPGIESLVDDVLKRMDKGVQSIHNVRTIRDGGSFGLSVTWNWLFGFPGERFEDYEFVRAQLPHLVHLQPPDGLARIDLQRFSPNFDNLELGFKERRPAEAYRYVYDIPAERLEDFVYSFDTNSQGLTDDQSEFLRESLLRWKENYPQSSLTERTIDGAVIIRDRRVDHAARDYVLEEPREITAWAELRLGRSLSALHRNLLREGLAWTEAELDRWVAELASYGLVFTEGGRVITLPTEPEARGGRPDLRRKAVIPLEVLPQSA
jgi:ribosomal peptide maturation radical SAM protein 1